VLISQDGIEGDDVFFVEDGKLVYVYNYVARDLYRVESTSDIPTGRHSLRYVLEVTTEPDVPNGIGAGGIGQLHSVMIDVSGDLIADTEVEMRAIMARQR
jgi:arylsulfatase